MIASNLPLGLSFWLILLATFLYGAVHSILASFTAKRLAEGLFGESIERVYRLAYNLFAALTLLPLLALSAWLPDHHLYQISSTWLPLTLALQALAILGLLVGVFHTGAGPFLGLSQLFKKNSSATPPSLMINGLYHWIRHPIYTFGLVFIWLIPRMTTNLLALNLGFTTYLLAGALLEERKLVTEFGDAYEQYRRQTPMLIPWKKRYNHQRAEKTISRGSVGR